MLFFTHTKLPCVLCGPEDGWSEVWVLVRDSGFLPFPSRVASQEVLFLFLSFLCVS